MRDQIEAPAASSLQYSIDNLDDCRASAYQCGLQAMDNAHERTLTPIYFSSMPSSTNFDATGLKASTNNYYKIRDAYSKI